MADALQAPLAVVPLPAGSRIVLEAIDPATGAAISGVTVSQVVISGEAREDVESVFLELGPVRLIPAG